MSLIKKVRATIDFYRGRKQDYRIFMTPEGQNVLRELLSLCNAMQTCYRDDPRDHARAEGRRDVWLHIQNRINLSPTQLFRLYNGETINVLEETEDGDHRND